MMRAGVDVGGTFTDLVLLDEQDGTVHAAKVPTTPDDPSRGVLLGLRKIFAATKAEPGDVVLLCHGTTIATNALIQRRGARTHLVTTRGFRDVLEIRRLARPPELLYDINVSIPEPVVRRRDRHELAERIGADGEVLLPLTADDVQALAKRLRAAGAEAVAICLLFSFRNPAHEAEVRRVLEDALPGCYIAASSSVLPEYREYERTSTTVINAYVGPLVASYITTLERQLQGQSLGGRFFVLQSNGGIAHPEVVGRLPVNLLLSGPAGGVVAGRVVGKMAGFENVITADMGGTSFDVALIADGEVELSDQREILGHVVKVPMLDVETIGAGGGSIAWVDAGGSFRVGPHSAGAVPGPACYGQGGQEPTVTDADMVLGYLNPDRPLGGEVTLVPDLAREACARLGARLALSPTEVASGIYRIVNVAMAGAVRTVSVRRGHDPRDFALVAFGGAGPVHAVAIADELSIPLVVVPRYPGCTSALGLVMTDMQHNYVRSYVVSEQQVDFAAVERLYREMEAQAGWDLARGSVPADRQVYTRLADIRYFGQDFTVTVRLGKGEFSPQALSSVRDDFHALHENRYGFRADGEPIEVVNLRLTGTGLVLRPELRRLSPGAGAATARVGTRRAFFAEAGDYVAAGVYERARLSADDLVAGPAIVEQEDSTTVVPPGWTTVVDAYGNLLVGRGDRPRAH